MDSEYTSEFQGAVPLVHRGLIIAMSGPSSISASLKISTPQFAENYARLAHNLDRGKRRGKPVKDRTKGEAEIPAMWEKPAKSELPLSPPPKTVSFGECVRSLTCIKSLICQINPVAK